MSHTEEREGHLGINRILGIGFVVVLLILGWAVFSDLSLLRLLWLAAIVAWAWQGWGTWHDIGWKEVPVGWKAQLLLFGQRVPGIVFTEGWWWTPLPFSKKPADCRRQTHNFTPLQALTKDNVNVTIGGSVVYAITNPDTYFSVVPDDLDGWLESTRKQILRKSIRGKHQEEVLGMHEELGKEVEQALCEASEEHWGVTIRQVIMPEITLDPEVAKDLALQERETYQRKGQRVEIVFGAEMINLLQAPKAEGGAGLTREQALEQVQLATEKATKTIDRKDISLDPIAAEIIGRFAAGIRGK
ncbi:MAG: SPFH domain-containing protein [Patescibacteria group bacterium]